MLFSLFFRKKKHQRYARLCSFSCVCYLALCSLFIHKHTTYIQIIIGGDVHRPRKVIHFIHILFVSLVSRLFCFAINLKYEIFDQMYVNPYRLRCASAVLSRERSTLRIHLCHVRFIFYLIFLF